MTTSGTVAFAPTVTQIVHDAGVKVSAVARGATMPSDVYDTFVFALNGMLKRWVAKGIKVWTVRTATLFPVPGQARYTIGHATAAENDHVTETYVETELAAAASSGATSITVDDDDGISDNDFIGIMLEDGTLHWTTVNGAPAANVIQIDDALTDDAADEAVVYAYTTKITMPVKIVGVRRKLIDGGVITPMDRMYARQEFEDMPDHAASGALSMPWYDRQIEAGYLNGWPTPSSPLQELWEFTWHRPIEDAGAAGLNVAIPQEWSDTLIWNLAKMMLGDYPVSASRKATIEDRSQELLDDMADMDREPEAVFFQPDMRAYRR